MTKRVKQLRQLLSRAGFSVVCIERRRKHLLATLEFEGRIGRCSFSLTPSDVRADLNGISQAKRKLRDLPSV